jgi:hypothetical protein
VKNRFQSLPFKFNLQRYTMVGGFEEAAAALTPKGVKVVKFRADGWGCTR